jgi:hypothetical protein
LVSKTMVCKVLTIGYLIITPIEQSFANPQLVVFGAPARSHHYKFDYFGKFSIRTNCSVQLNGICAL